MGAANAQLVAVEEPLPPEIAGAPLWAQMLWTLHRREHHDRANREMILDGRLSGFEDALVGHSRNAAEAHDELVHTVNEAIGKPSDETGHGGSGLAGEISRLTLLIGREPEADGSGGKGMLGRLAEHDKHRRIWESRWANFRVAGAVAAFFGAILWFVLQDRLAHLFKAPV